MRTAAERAGPQGARRSALLGMEAVAESEAVTRPPQSRTWSLAWSHWAPLCSWWSWTQNASSGRFSMTLPADRGESSWQEVYIEEESFSCTYSCLISWIFSWQSSSSGWSWARCLASCSLAVCRGGRDVKTFSQRIQGFEGGRTNRNHLQLFVKMWNDLIGTIRQMILERRF